VPSRAHLVWTLAPVLTGCGDAIPAPRRVDPSELPRSREVPLDLEGAKAIYTSLDAVHAALQALPPQNRCPDAAISAEAGDRTVLPIHNSELVRLLDGETTEGAAHGEVEKLIEALTDPHVHKLPSRKDLAEFRNAGALALATERYRSREYLAVTVPVLERDAGFTPNENNQFDAGFILAELIVVRKRDAVPICSNFLVAESSKSVEVKNPGRADMDLGTDLHMIVKTAATASLAEMSTVLRYPDVLADTDDFLDSARAAGALRE
jgi:hypothetical protein